MFSFIKKLFRKPEPKPVVPRVVRAVPHASGDSALPRPQVEVAHLSLAAILARFPDDLKRNIASMPDPSVTVALPLATIHKQLPTGSVRMSLASLYRQAPPGVFAGQLRAEDKRMVEIPLPEVFRHVKLQALKRREQKQMDVPEDAPELFGDRDNPYAIAPNTHEEPSYGEAIYEDEESAPAPAPVPRVVRPTASPRQNGGLNRGIAPPTNGLGHAAAAPAATPAPVPVNRVAAAAAKPSAASTAGGEPPLVLPLAQLCQAWPEPMRGEALALGDATVALPAAPITAGVAKGKVAFTWGQIRSWLNPPCTTPTQGREAMELVLPLKVVAPAFLAKAKPKTQKKKLDVDESIPALFSGGEAARPGAPAPAPEPEPAAEEPGTNGAEAPQAHAAPATLPAPSIPPLTVLPAPTLEQPVAAPASIPAPTLEPAPQAPAKPASPQTIGEMLGQPDKETWSPQELLKAAIKQPGVGGAILGLDEGLLVAAELPPEFKGDTLAAFLPQMFARLNNYSGEMKLGAVSELLLTTGESHFQAYKFGELYLGVIGKPGESLPWDALRLISDQLRKQH